MGSLAAFREVGPILRSVLPHQVLSLPRYNSLNLRLMCSWVPHPSALGGH